MILTDNETRVDLLNNEAIASSIIAVLSEQPSRPITIGVHGDWGGGKSSILEMVEQAEKEKPGNMVRQHVPLANIPMNFFEHSLPTIQTVDELTAALISRYAPLFPGLTTEELLLRGCAITEMSLE